MRPRSPSRSRIPAEGFIKSGALVPVFVDRKGMRVHAHHVVFPGTHGKWSKVERFIGWLRREVSKSAVVSERKPRRK